jgi:hypothetical protein
VKSPFGLPRHPSFPPDHQRHTILSWTDNSRLHFIKTECSDYHNRHRQRGFRSTQLGQSFAFFSIISLGVERLRATKEVGNPIFQERTQPGALTVWSLSPLFGSHLYTDTYRYRLAHRYCIFTIRFVRYNCVALLLRPYRSDFGVHEIGPPTCALLTRATI